MNEQGSPGSPPIEVPGGDPADSPENATPDDSFVYSGTYNRPGSPDTGTDQFTVGNPGYRV